MTLYSIELSSKMSFTLIISISITSIDVNTSILHYMKFKQDVFTHIYFAFSDFRPEKIKETRCFKSPYAFTA